VRLAVKELDASSDADLLKRFVERREEAAFAALLHRHSDMVLRVCQRVLMHTEDAEDACQATFLVLARRAGSIRKTHSLVSWLHGVALKVSRGLRREAMRQARPKRIAEGGNNDPITPITWQETMQVLDEELDRLPLAYRAPLVLCYLEGQPMDVAAGQLGWTLGSFRGRLERGRELLRKRLIRRGITLPAVLFGIGLATSSASAGLSTAKMAATVQAVTLIEGGRAATTGLVSAKVAALVEGMVTTMAFAKFKSAAILALVVGVICVNGFFLGGGFAGQKGDTRKETTKADAKPEKQAKDDKQLLQGTWVFVSGEAKGRKFPAESLKNCRMTFKDNTFIMRMAQTKEGTYTLDPKAKPRAIDLTIDGGTGEGIYALEGDMLKLCLSEKQKQNRPTEFSGKDKESNQVYFVLKRDTKAGKNLKENGAAANEKAIPNENLILKQRVKALEAVLSSANSIIDRLKEVIKLERESLAGKLAKIEVEKNTMSITLRNTKLVIEAIPLSTGIKVYLDGKEGSINDLKVGMQVVLEFETVDGKTTISSVRGRTEAKKKDSPEDNQESKARNAPNAQLRRAWLDLEGKVPTGNDIAVAALCWAVKEQMRDKPFTPWLGGKPIKVDWPLDNRFARFASLDLCGVLPKSVTDHHLRRVWLDLYGLVMTDREKEDAALKWIRFRHKKAGQCDASI
jgi:RNA polymerase sigma factor (sigma-70 family)